MILVPMARPMDAHWIPMWKIREGIGFVMVPCGACQMNGSPVTEPLPHLDPSQWPHRVPEGAWEA